MNINPTDLNYILAVLGERPYREVGALIEDLRRQADEPDHAATRIAELEEECANLHLELSAALSVNEVLNETLLDYAPVPIRPDVAEDLPAWRCHEVVWADKITRAERNTSTPHYLIRAGAITHRVSEAQVNNFPVHDTDDLGYLVIYKDGYVSWSPTEAFEQGYTRIDA